MALAEESGAYLPGSPGQDLAFTESSFAAVSSMPPGAEAMSKITAEGLTRERAFLVSVMLGIVLKIKSYLFMRKRKDSKRSVSSA